MRRLWWERRLEGKLPMRSTEKFSMRRLNVEHLVRSCSGPANSLRSSLLDARGMPVTVCRINPCTHSCIVVVCLHVYRQAWPGGRAYCIMPLFFHPSLSHLALTHLFSIPWKASNMQKRVYACPFLFISSHLR